MEIKAPDSSGSAAHIASIDAIRFLSAYAVVLHHTIGRPAFLVSNGWDWGADLFGSLWFGRAAVMVFFLISGFCIHAPYVRNAEFDVIRFWTRRYIRLLVPLTVVLLIAAMVGVSYHPTRGWITWTLVCELAYYTSYPVLRLVWQRLGWPLTIAVSYAIGYAALLIGGGDDGGIALPLAKSVLSSLAVWLIGCWLAEAVLSGRPVAIAWLQFARVGIVLATIVVGMLHYRQVVDPSWTGPIYGAVAAPWLWLEIVCNRNFGPFSSWGQWSYSLYLVHPVAFMGSRPFFDLFALPSALKTPIAIAFTLGCAFLFFRLVERPSHRLARALSASRLVARERLVEHAERLMVLVARREPSTPKESRDPSRVNVHP